MRSAYRRRESPRERPTGRDERPIPTMSVGGNARQRRKQRRLVRRLLALQPKRRQRRAR